LHFAALCLKKDLYKNLRERVYSIKREDDINSEFIVEKEIKIIFVFPNSKCNTNRAT
jgi:hypothetical protein